MDIPHGYSIKLHLPPPPTNWAGVLVPAVLPAPLPIRSRYRPALFSELPYTMTYAYALVLENGTRTIPTNGLCSSATLSTPDSTITCASPEYYLPLPSTLAKAEAGGGGIAVLLRFCKRCPDGHVGNKFFPIQCGWWGSGGSGGGAAVALYLE